MSHISSPSIHSEGSAQPTNNFTYDAFLSYKHFVHDDLALAMRNHIQKYARPWLKRRSSHIFLDRSHLVPNPALWKTLQDALDRSKYLIVLASPESAASPSIQREIKYWVANRSPENIIIVQTGGTIQWDEESGDFNWSRTTALPVVLRGVFKEEPLYLQLMPSQHSETEITNQTAFNDVIASIAALLRGRPKEDLVGEEARLHRNAIRRAWSIVGILAALTLFLVVAILYAVRGESKALHEAQTAKEALDVLVSSFSSADPIDGLGPEVKVREMLEIAAATIRTELQDRPLIRARLSVALAQVYRNLSLYPSARSLLDDAIAIYREEQGEYTAETVKAQLELGGVYHKEANLDRAEACYKAARACYAAAGINDDIEAANIKSAMADLYHSRAKFRDALQLYSEALQLREKAFGPSDLKVAETLYAQGLTHYRLGEYQQAQRCLERSYNIRKLAKGPGNPLSIVSMLALAKIDQALGRLDVAQQRCLECLKLSEEALPANHPTIAEIHYALGSLYYQMGRREEAKQSLKRALEIRRSKWPNGHPFIGNALLKIGMILRDEGRFSEAESSLHEALSIYQVTLGVESPEYARCLRYLGSLYHTMGREFDKKAESAFSKAVAIYRQRFPDGGDERLSCLRDYMRFLNDRNRGEVAKAVRAEIENLSSSNSQ